jgi:hypothetical protein
MFGTGFQVAGSLYFQALVLIILTAVYIHSTDLIIGIVIFLNIFTSYQKFKIYPKKSLYKP